MERRRRVSRIRTGEEDARKAQSDNEITRQAEGGGVIASNDQDLNDISENKSRVDFSMDCMENKSQEDQGKPEGGGVM